MPMTFKDLCGGSVVTISAGDSLAAAARRMRDMHVGNLVVVDDERRPIGILTDRDIVVTAVAQSAERMADLSVCDVMTRDVVTTTADDSIYGALNKMRGHGVRRLPIVDADGRLQGVVALDDLVAMLAEEMSRLADVFGSEHGRELESRS
jgi:CBS domain-containing protein